MPRKLRQLRADLRRAGCFIIQKTSGSHERWAHAAVVLRITLAGQDGADAHPYQERDVKKMLQAIENARRQQP